MSRLFALPWPEAAARLGHYATAILISAIVGATVIGLYPPQGPLALTVPIALFIVVIGAWMMMRQHDRRFTRCHRLARRNFLLLGQLQHDFPAQWKKLVVPRRGNLFPGQSPVDLLRNIYDLHESNDPSQRIFAGCYRS